MIKVSELTKLHDHINSFFVLEPFVNFYDVRVVNIQHIIDLVVVLILMLAINYSFDHDFDCEPVAGSLLFANPNS